MDAVAISIQGGDGMNDLISRQAAIDAINHICPVDTEYDCALLDRVDVRCVLSDLPPAQPEIVRCKDCKFGVYEKGRGIYHIRCEMLEFLFQDDDYCSYGERKEE